MQKKRSQPCKLPVPEDKRTGKCSMSTNPNCDKMQEKFEYIKAGIEDRRDELQDQLAELIRNCRMEHRNIEAQIGKFETELMGCHTELATCTKRQNDAEEAGRLKSISNYETLERHAV
eukprot:TRINITY_DN17511_c0_g1_i3.p8 TRINITY_DN17511_c0_g1~~TRINITY_DN17511_c0_g1_i3.p8  ORF type:complete len:118 (+),score=34.79 TRINITY_DN17511_c0_g1_i3:808-1161(+)